jgi:beta-fructofuranosidase
MKCKIEMDRTRRAFLQGSLAAMGVVSLGGAVVSNTLDEPQEGHSDIHETILNYRKVIKSQHLETYRAAASIVRWHMIEADPYRPLYHFTGVESWINDPNGPIYHEDKYHLFYQFDPQVSDGKGGWKRSKRCWGHAVSNDLVHWVDWPVALWPDTPYDYGGVYSGNTFIHSGKIYGLYTGNVSGHRKTYGILTWSEDGGLTFKKRMVMHDNQRPNKDSPVHWDAQVWKEGDTWCQLIGGTTERREQGAAWLWKSRDLNNWKLQRNIAPSVKHSNYWELPYLVPVDGRHALMVGAGNPYWIGTYDVETMEFLPETRLREVDTGHYYSFNPHMVDDKGPNGSQRRLMLGWATIGRPPAVDGVPYWESAHSIPRVIFIKQDRLWQEPIPELQCLRWDRKEIQAQVLPANKPVPLRAFRGDALEIIASFDRGDAKRCGLIVRADKEGNGAQVWADADGNIGINDIKNQVFHKPREEVALRVFVDRGVLEVYCNGGAVTHKCFAGSDCAEVFAFGEGGNCTLMSLEGWKMKSMWEQAHSG